MRYFSPVLDISTFDRPFHTILCAERSAYVLQRQTKARNSEIAIIGRFLRKRCVISLPFKMFRRLNGLFTPFNLQNVVHAFSTAETSPGRHKSHSYVVFEENYALFLSGPRYFEV